MLGCRSQKRTLVPHSRRPREEKKRRAGSHVSTRFSYCGDSLATTLRVLSCFSSTSETFVPWCTCALYISVTLVVLSPVSATASGWWPCDCLSRPISETGPTMPDQGRTQTILIRRYGNVQNSMSPGSKPHDPEMQSVTNQCLLSLACV